MILILKIRWIVRNSNFSLIYNSWFLSRNTTCCWIERIAWFGPAVALPKSATPVEQCKIAQNRSCCKNVDFHNTFATPYLYIRANSCQVNVSFCVLGPSRSTKIVVLAMLNNCLVSRIKQWHFSDLEIAIWSYAHQQIMNLHKHYVDFPSMIAVFMCIAANPEIVWSYTQRWFSHIWKFQVRAPVMPLARHVANNAFCYKCCTELRRSYCSSVET